MDKSTETPTPSQRKSKSRAPILIGIVIVAIVAVTAIKLRFFSGEFRYAGTLEATEVELSSRVPSVISDIAAKEGDTVKKGQPLIKLACEDLRLVGDLANTGYERVRKLYATGALPKEQYDVALNKKQEADTRLGWCEVAAPIGGRVTNVYLEPGEWANPGTKLVSLADLSEVWAYIYVPQPVIHKLKLGMSVTGILPEMGGREFKGVIRKINSEAEFTPKNVQTQAERTRLVFGVKIAFANPEETLKPGMTIEVPLFEE